MIRSFISYFVWPFIHGPRGHDICVPTALDWHFYIICASAAEIPPFAASQCWNSPNKDKARAHAGGAQDYGTTASAALGHVPDVQEFGVTGGGHGMAVLPSGAIQRGTNLGLARGQFAQGHLERGAVVELVQVPQDGGDDFLVFSMAALRHVDLRHGLEMHGSDLGGASFGLARIHGNLLLPNTYTKLHYLPP